jgi:quercetin dioxygenase-like cupin family protein
LHCCNLGRGAHVAILLFREGFGDISSFVHYGLRPVPYHVGAQTNPVSLGVDVPVMRPWRVTMRSANALLTIAAGTLLLGTIGQATEPAGIESNVLLAQGRTLRPLKDEIRFGSEWMVSLEDRGQSEFYFQDFAMRPGGRSGWHSHPGLLLVTVKEGSVDWYDRDCVKHSYTAGQSFTEGAEAHNVVNSGSGSARLLIAYIVKSGEPRRIENPQPKCGESLQLR